MPQHWIIISMGFANFEIKTVLLGFGLETDAIHSPNENFPLKNFYNGIETIPWFYHFYSEFKKQM